MNNLPISTNLDNIDQVDFYSLHEKKTTNEDEKEKGKKKEDEETVGKARLNVETLEFNWIFDEENAA